MAILAIPFPTYQPAMRIVTNITNGFPCVVTTSFDHQYITGLIVRIDIPRFFGMQQINQKFGPITVLSDTTFSIPIDTTYFDVFSVPSGNEQYAQCVPFAEVNEILTGATQNVLPY